MKMASTRTSTEDGGDDGESITTETKSVEDAEKRGKGKRSRKGRRPKHRTASMDMDSCDDDIRILSGEGKIESANDTCEIHYDDSNICFQGLFADLQHFKEDNNHLTISISHPTFISIMDNFSAVGMEELLKKRWENQFNSLKDFTKKHGDCNVPLEHPTLGEWVRIQRGHYELYKKRLPTPLTKKRFMKLEEILGFDEYNKSQEEDADKNLTMDERTSLKTAANNVRLMGRANRAFYASAPAKKKSPCKEMVADEIQKIREAGNFHTSAVHRSLLLKEVFASIEEDESSNSSFADNNDAGRENEKKKRKEQKDKEQYKIFSSSMSATSTSDVSAKEHQEEQDSSTSADTFEEKLEEFASVDVYEEKLEKLKRKLLAETNSSFYKPTNATNSSTNDKVTLKAAANKVKLTGGTTKAFSSLSEKKVFPDKEVVAAEIRKKRAEGTAYRSAVHRSLTLKEAFASSDENLNLNAAAAGENSEKHEKEKNEYEPQSSSMPEISMRVSIEGENEMVVIEENGRSFQHKNSTNLKVAASKVRAIGRTAKAFSSLKKKLPDKGVAVAPTMRKKGTKGNSHPSAVHSSLLLKDVSTSSPRVVEEEETLGAAMSVVSMSASTKEDNKRSDLTVDTYEEKMEKLVRRKLSEEENRSIYEPASKSLADDVRKGSKGSVDSDVGAHKKKTYRRRATDDCLTASTPPEASNRLKRKNKPYRRRATDDCLSSSMPPQTPDLTVDTYGEKMEKLIRQKLLEEENRSIYKPTSKSSVKDVIKDSKGIVASDAEAHEKESSLRRSSSMPPKASSGSSTFEDRLNRKFHSKNIDSNPGAHGKKPYRRRATDDYLSASMSAKVSSSSSTFEDRLIRKLQGDSVEDIYRDRNKKHLSASMPPQPADGTFTVEDRLYRRLGGNSTETIDENRPGPNGRELQKQISFSVEEMIEGPLLAVEDADPFENTPSSGWRSKLNASSRESKDDIGIGSWSSLDTATPSQGAKFSRWKLLFDEAEYADKKAQSDCVSSALNTIIYSDKWRFIPKENGDVSLEITTQSLDEHKTVELYVKELDHLYTRSDFYYY